MLRKGQVRWLPKGDVLGQSFWGACYQLTCGQCHCKVELPADLPDQPERITCQPGPAELRQRNGPGVEGGPGLILGEAGRMLFGN